MRARWETALAVAVIALLAAGDAVRYLVGYVGWGVVSGIGLACVVVVLVRRRARWRAPVPVVALLALAVASAAWSVSAPGTLLGAALQVATAAAGLMLATLGVDRLLVLLERTLQGILALSLAFELVVAVVVGGRLYPVVPLPGASYDGPDVPASYAWSRGELLEGGRIQGIVGNANLLAMLALLALVLAACRCVAERDRAWPLWIGLPLATLALTRSATVLVVLAVVAAVAASMVVASRVHGRRRRVVAWSAAGIAIGGTVAVVVLRERLLALVGRDADLTGRLDIWAAVADRWASSPLVGIGWFGYWPPWIAPFDDLAIHDGVRYLQAHSVALDVLMQLGIVGLAVWAWLQLVAFRGAARGIAATHGRARAAAAAPVLVLVALLVQGLAESRPLIELGFALLVALVAAWRVRDASARPVAAGSAS